MIVTARLFVKEGLSEDEAVRLLMQYAREIPQEARHCSSRLIKGDWASIDQDITKAVKNAYRGNGKQGDVDHSDQELTKTIAAWAKYGFKLSDKATWNQRGGRWGHHDQLDRSRSTGHHPVAHASAQDRRP